MPEPGLAAPTARAAPHVPLPCPRHYRSSPPLGYCVVGRAGRAPHSPARLPCWIPKPVRRFARLAAATRRGGATHRAILQEETGTRWRPFGGAVRDQPGCRGKTPLPARDRLSPERCKGRLSEIQQTSCFQFFGSFQHKVKLSIEVNAAARPAGPHRPPCDRRHCSTGLGHSCRVRRSREQHSIRVRRRRVFPLVSQDGALSFPGDEIGHCRAGG
jgi:hypothetical protein